MRRWRSPHVQPLELWDAMIDGRSLFAWQREPVPLFPVLGKMVEQVLAGTTSFEDGRPALPPLSPLGHLHLLGGGTIGVEIPALLPGANLPITVAADPMFAAAEAGARLAPGALVVDLGQTAVKVLRGDRRQRCPRDRARLPWPAEVDEALLPSLRREVIAFVVEVVGDLGTGAPAVVLALPCELDHALVASGSSYPYPKDDRTLAADLLAALGLAGVPALVLNDAELAAEAAALDPRVPRDRHTLVLTLGFGVGAALLRARP